jgi:hypothetical protein
MPLEIFPQNVIVYPNDRQVFTARATDRTPMWKITADPFGVVQSDYSIRPSFSNTAPSGEGAFQLVRGVGSVEWTLDASCIPVSPSEIGFGARLRRPAISSSWIYGVRLSSSNLVVRDELGTILATLVITPTVGMRIRVEIASGFYLYIDDVLRHSRTSFATAVAYPAIYNASIIGSVPYVVAGPPRIPAPRLSGDWQLPPTDSFGNAMVSFTVEHGSLGAGANHLQKEYSGGTVPGIYKLAANISPGSNIWLDNGPPTGATVSASGGVWAWNLTIPSPPGATVSLDAPLAAGRHFYAFTGATDTLQINKDDILVVWVYLDVANPPQEILVEWRATDATSGEHRAYWGANLIALGADGTPSRRFMGAMPATGVWTKLEVPASLVDLEGRVLNGMSLEFYDGEGGFDRISKYPGKVQRAEAIITIPPLQILGDLVRTLQSGQKVRFQTNYDIAQTPNLVTWSVQSGGGSFSQGEFTAPSAPGTTVVRASTTGNQVTDLTIKVPAVITPNFVFAGPSETIDWGTNIPTPTWTASAGPINASTGVWTAPSGIGQTVKITASNGTFTATRDVLIMKKFPITSVSAPIQWRRSKTVLVSEAEDGTRVSRIKNKGGSPREAYEVRITLLTLTDLETIQAFWDEHYPGKQFVFEDVPRNIRKVVYFDSDINAEGSARAFDVSFRVKEA